jgi:acyl-CoA-binding protein
LKAKAKWSAWSDRKGMSKDEAKEAYVKLIDDLANKYM